MAGGASSRPSHWLLLRGLVREGAHWADFPARLEQTFPGTRVTVLDLPGNGAACHLTSPMNIAATAEWARAQVGSEPVSLMAISLGAMVAIEWLRQAPAQVSHLVVINTSLRTLSPFWQRLRPAQYTTIARLLLHPDPLWREQTILRMTTHLNSHTEALARQWVAISQEHPVTRANAIRQLWAAATYRPPLAPPTCPTLILTSQQDELVNTRCSERLAQAWGVPIAKHPTAGHDLPLDDSPWICQHLSQWLGVTT